MAEKLSDLVLVASDGQKFYTSKFVMYHASEKFRGLFDGSWADSNEGERKVECSASVLGCLVDYALRKKLTIPKEQLKEDVPNSAFVLELYDVANEYLFMDIISPIIDEMIAQYPTMEMKDKIRVVNAAVIHDHENMLKLIEPWMSSTKEAGIITGVVDILRCVKRNVKKHEANLLALVPLFGNQAYKISLERIIVVAIYNNFPVFWTLLSAHKRPRSIDFWVMESIVKERCRDKYDKPIPDNTLSSIQRAMRDVIEWTILELKFE